MAGTLFMDVYDGNYQATWWKNDTASTIGPYVGNAMSINHIESVASCIFIK